MKTEAAPRSIFSVSEISRRIKNLVEPGFPDVWVEGEISNLRRSAAGHIYFTLKDESAQLPAVCFRNAVRYLRFKPRDGESFRARGRITTYEARGEYQIIVDVLEPAGRGALQAAFERLKEKLEREGLFDPARKRPLPRYPAVVGIVTSERSAALRDVLSVLHRRHNGVNVLIYPCDVQGAGAAAQLAEGVRVLGGQGVDIVLVTRGGGSIEDLSPFNDERLARAIADCPKPVVSAVGHETDFTVSDFVADLRAPTPSAAAEIIVATKLELSERLDTARERMANAMRHRLTALREFLSSRVGGRGFAVAESRIRLLVRRVDDCGFRLDRLGRAGELLGARQRRVEAAASEMAYLVERLSSRTRMRVGDLRTAAIRSMERQVYRDRERFVRLAETLGALSPLAVLDRGYAVCRTRDGRILRSAGAVNPGAEVAVLLHEGRIRAEVLETSGPGAESAGIREER